MDSLEDILAGLQQEYLEHAHRIFVELQSCLVHALRGDVSLHPTAIACLHRIRGTAGSLELHSFANPAALLEDHLRGVKLLAPEVVSRLADELLELFSEAGLNRAKDR